MSRGASTSPSQSPLQLLIQGFTLLLLISCQPRVRRPPLPRPPPAVASVQAERHQWGTESVLVNARLEVSTGDSCLPPLQDKEPRAAPPPPWGWGQWGPLTSGGGLRICTPKPTFTDSQSSNSAKDVRLFDSLAHLTIKYGIKIP